MAEFKKGDHVVYPPHGAGTVVSTSKREGDVYLSIEIAHSKMTLMVPADGATDRGVRPVIDQKQLKAVLKVLKGERAELDTNPQHRARATAEKARTGGAVQLAEIVRDMVGRERAGSKLSPAEQTTLASARQLLASEIMYVQGIDEPSAQAVIDKALGKPPE